MQKRHFLVREVNGDYKLREIDAAIADGINEFGTMTGSFNSVESVRWIFYFMNCNIGINRADKVAAQLTQDFLMGKRQ